MVAPLDAPFPLHLLYPESDGQPMADNTVQFRWITVIKYNLDWLFAEDPNVFVAGDLLWYPVRRSRPPQPNEADVSQAPDVMVVFGRPKGDRGSYIQVKENNIPPQVVFEILSPNNTSTEMRRKLNFYNRYGVEEYYLYDPMRNRLQGWQRQRQILTTIEPMKGWVSPRLQIRFDLSEETMLLYRPDGKPFTDFVEVQRALEQAEQERDRALLERQQAEQERDRAFSALEQERQQREALLARLRAMGIDPENL